MALPGLVVHSGCEGEGRGINWWESRFRERCEDCRRTPLSRFPASSHAKIDLPGWLRHGAEIATEGNCRRLRSPPLRRLPELFHLIQRGLLQAAALLGQRLLHGVE